MRWTLLSMVVAVVGCAMPPDDGAADAGDRTVDPGDAAAVVDSARATAASGPDGGEDAALGPTFASVQTIFRASCSGYCHAGGSNVGASLVLAPQDGSEPALAGRPSREVPRLMLVAPGDPGSSYLMMKIDGTMATQPECTASTNACGFPMPYSYYARASLSAAQRDAIRGWIAAGAPGPFGR